ncbi:Maf family protein [Agaribacter flavus]|uniref:dTTP/UTP pyrophosphatase n=1 Tax=Agaribacter flavus TaxID=1902781 RepID=A0ABV7FX74_9ALTE
MSKLILASASPRRAHLLGHLVSDFEVIAADVDETVKAMELPDALVSRLAALKAKAVYDLQETSSRRSIAVLGSDTVVAADDRILCKPTNFKDFHEMMSILSNSVHQVYTGVCLIHEKLQQSIVVKTEVYFSPISEMEIEDYWQTGEPQDKAGGYAIQGVGGKFVERIHGSYSAVVGLPLVETKNLLSEAGILNGS